MGEIVDHGDHAHFIGGYGVECKGCGQVYKEDYQTIEWQFCPKCGAKLAVVLTPKD